MSRINGSSDASVVINKGPNIIIIIYIPHSQPSAKIHSKMFGISTHFVCTDVKRPPDLLGMQA